MSNAVWFALYPTTSELLSEIRVMAYELVRVQDGIELAKQTICDREKVLETIERLKMLVRDTQAKAVFGNIITPYLSVLWEEHMRKKDVPMLRDMYIPVYASWYLNNPATGAISPKWRVIQTLYLK